MNVDRLLLAAATLDNYDNEHNSIASAFGHVTVFDMNSWIQPASAVAENTCGTAACAIGYLASTPRFNAMGLSLSNASRLGGPLVLLTNAPVYVTEGKYAQGWDAVVDFFDVSVDTAFLLFGPNAYTPAPSPRDVADRIRMLVVGYVNEVTAAAQERFRLAAQERIRAAQALNT